MADLFGSVRALCLDVAVDMQGVDAVITPPDEPPITGKVIWLTPATELTPSGFSFRGAASRRSLCIKRSDLAEVPPNTLIVATGPAGGPARTWKVDGHADPAGDHHRVFVIETAP